MNAPCSVWLQCWEEPQKNFAIPWFVWPTREIAPFVYIMWCLSWMYRNLSLYHLYLHLSLIVQFKEEEFLFITPNFHPGLLAKSLWVMKRYYLQTLEDHCPLMTLSARCINFLSLCPQLHFSCFWEKRQWRVN
jgi:hypothetical protein